MESKLLVRDMLGKCEVFWSHLEADIEAFQMHLVTTTYEYGEMAAGRAERWNLVITMVRFIWREIIKFRVEVEIDYGLKTRSVMVFQYLWGVL